MSNPYISLSFQDTDSDHTFAVGYRTKEMVLHASGRFAAQYQCSIILNGSVNLMFPDYFYPLAAHSAYQHFPNDPFPEYQYLSEDYLEYFICVDASVYESMKRFQVLYTASCVFEIRNDPVFHHWMREHAATPIVDTTEDVFEFFLNTQKLLHFLHKASKQYSQSNERSRLQDVLPILAANYQAHLDLAALAHGCGYTYETFRKKFKEVIGMSPLQFHMTCKFQYARRLLKDGYTISQVAELTGYTDNFTFSKQFKKYMGENPKNARK